MCDNNVGVAKRLDLEHISKEMADLIEKLNKDVKSGEVNVPVQDVKKITKKLEGIIK
jgi:hypothetical protein